MSDPGPETHRCGEPKADGSPCQRRVTEPDAVCFMHDGSGPPADQGAPAESLQQNGNAVSHGLHASVETMLESLEEWERDAYEGYFTYYAEKGVELPQAKTLALLATFEDRCGVDLADSFHRTVYSEDGQPMEVPKSKMMEAHARYVREKRLLEHYRGISEHGSGSGATSGHDNLHLLVEGGDVDQD